MRAQEILRSLRLPELDEFSQFVHMLLPPTLVGIASFAAVITYWLATKPKALKPPCDLSQQSQEIEGGEQAHRSVLSDSPKLLTHYYNETRTMYEVYQRGLRITGECLFVHKSSIYSPQVSDRAEYLGSGLLQKGCGSSPEQFIGVFAQNRPEWIIAELACYTYSMVIVPLYDTLGPEAIRYIINTAEISTVICDNEEKAKILLKNVEKKETPGMKIIILMDPLEAELVEMGRNCGVEIVALQEVEVRRQCSCNPPRPEDLSIVCFTSGTTGNPKGAMLTHGNVVADFSAFLKVTEVNINAHMILQDDVLISFLPLAHMFERVIQSVVVCHGGRIGFFQGDIKLLSDDMKALRPTIFPVVPRLLNRMYDKIFSQAGTPVKRWLLKFAAKRKEIEVRNGIIRNNSLWDKFFFNKIQNSLGGEVRMIITGAAPASPAVLGFLRAALGCQVYEGYGQTECTAGCTFTTPGDWTSGHVGAPLPCNFIKLIDVRDMKYFSAKGEGEICVKGPNVFKGYLKDPKKTTEALDEDEWLHTGDIGKWLPNGTLKIIDRKKHIFKLAQGEYVAPEKIENIYIRSEPVAQVYVHGDSLQVNQSIPLWLNKFASIGQQKEINRNAVKDIYIHCEMFSIQNGLLTPTLKAKRPELRNYFRKQIEELYTNTST
uniref:Long-chain-fatty-acid--CoA ligase n=1 Tax=Callorhinchus milii TaxID=7868 RepID=A0A4W3H2X0_CALMI